MIEIGGYSEGTGMTCQTWAAMMLMKLGLPALETAWNGCDLKFGLPQRASTTQLAGEDVTTCGVLGELGQIARYETNIANLNYEPCNDECAKPYNTHVRALGLREYFEFEWCLWDLDTCPKERRKTCG